MRIFLSSGDKSFKYMSVIPAALKNLFYLPQLLDCLDWAIMVISVAKLRLMLAMIPRR